ncbi:MLP-like protein 28, partial [Quillaja saponaria]
KTSFLYKQLRYTHKSIHQEMALQGKVETEVEMKVPDDKFCNIWWKQAHHVPTASPNNIEAVHVHDVDWETEGSIKVWKYNIGTWSKPSSFFSLISTQINTD